MYIRIILFSVYVVYLIYLYFKFLFFIRKNTNFLCLYFDTQISLFFYTSFILFFIFILVRNMNTSKSLSISVFLFSPANVSGGSPRTYTGCRVGVGHVVHTHSRRRGARGGVARYPTAGRRYGMERKRAVVYLYSCQSCRRDYVSCLANPFSTSHDTGGTWCGRDHKRFPRAAGRRSAARR